MQTGPVSIQSHSNHPRFQRNVLVAGGVGGVVAGVGLVTGILGTVMGSNNSSKLHTLITTKDGDTHELVDQDGRLKPLSDIAKLLKPHVTDKPVPMTQAQMDQAKPVQTQPVPPVLQTGTTNHVVSLPVGSASDQPWMLPEFQEAEAKKATSLHSLWHFMRRMLPYALTPAVTAMQVCDANGVVSTQQIESDVFYACVDFNMRIEDTSVVMVHPHCLILTTHAWSNDNKQLVLKCEIPVSPSNSKSSGPSLNVQFQDFAPGIGESRMSTPHRGAVWRARLNPPRLLEKEYESKSMSGRRHMKVVHQLDPNESQTSVDITFQFDRKVTWTNPNSRWPGWTLKNDKKTGYSTEWELTYTSKTSKVQFFCPMSSFEDYYGHPAHGMFVSTLSNDYVPYVLSSVQDLGYLKQVDPKYTLGSSLCAAGLNYGVYVSPSNWEKMFTTSSTPAALSNNHMDNVNSAFKVISNLRTSLPGPNETTKDFVSRLVDIHPIIAATSGGEYVSIVGSDPKGHLVVCDNGLNTAKHDRNIGCVGHYPNMDGNLVHLPVKCLPPHLSSYDSTSLFVKDPPSDGSISIPNESATIFAVADHRSDDSSGSGKLMPIQLTVQDNKSSDSVMITVQIHGLLPDRKYELFCYKNPKNAGDVPSADFLTDYKENGQTKGTTKTEVYNTGEKCVWEKTFEIKPTDMLVWICQETPAAPVYK
jgi:hypothetical protein